MHINNDKNDWEEFWEKRQKSLSGKFLYWGRRRFVTEALVDFMAKNTEKGVLLEAGAGTGEASILLAKRRGDEIILVDMSPKALSASRFLADKAGVRASFILCDISFLEKHVDRLKPDIAWNTGVVEHFDPVGPKLKIMAHCSRRFALAIMPQDSWFWRFFIGASRALKLVPKDFYIRLYGSKDFAEEVKNTGLEFLWAKRLLILGFIPYLAVAFREKGPS